MNRTWYAFRVMLSQARRDPLWALGCIIFYPLRLGVHALKVFLAGSLPIIARKLRYYADREFAGLVQPTNNQA